MEEEKDLIPEDTTRKRRLRCYCGETVIETSQVGNSPKCIKCPECHSTLAESKSKCEQSVKHEWSKPIGGVKYCQRCMAEEVEERILSDEDYNKLMEYAREQEED